MPQRMMEAPPGKSAKKERSKQLPDSEIRKRVDNILPLLQRATEKKMAEGGG